MGAEGQNTYTELYFSGYFPIYCDSPVENCWNNVD